MSSLSISTLASAISIWCSAQNVEFVYDLTDVVQDITKLPQSLIRDRRISTLSLLPASQTRDKDALTEEGVGCVIAKLRELFRLGDLR